MVDSICHQGLIELLKAVKECVTHEHSSVNRMGYAVLGIIP